MREAKYAKTKNENVGIIFSISFAKMSHKLVVRLILKHHSNFANFYEFFPAIFQILDFGKIIAESKAGRTKAPTGCFVCFIAVFNFRILFDKTNKLHFSVHRKNMEHFALRAGMFCYVLMLSFFSCVSNRWFQNAHQNLFGCFVFAALS